MKSTTLPGLVAPFGIVAAADGSAWFTEYDSGPAPARNGGRVAQIAPDLGLTELPNLANQTGVFDSSRFDPKPKGITIDGSGTPWFAEYSAGLPGYRIAKVSGAAYTEYFPPCVAGSSYCSGQASGSALSDVAAGHDGAIWYTNELKRTVGRLVPGQTVTEFPLAQLGTGLGAGTPRAISVAPDGTLWLAVAGGAATSANAIVKIVPSDPPVATTWTLGARLGPLAVAPDSKGNVWFSGGPLGGAGLIGRLVGVTGTTTPDGGGGGGGGTTPPPAATPATSTAGTTTTTLTMSIVAEAKVTDPTVRGTSITANQICVGPPQDRCSLVYLIQTHEYVRGFPGSGGRMAAARS